MQLTQEQNVLFSLIKTSLWPEKDGEVSLLPSGGVDWEALIALAARQGVLAVSYDGLPKNHQIPGLSKGLLIRWALSVQNLEARNEAQKKVLGELVTLFREHGMEMLLLKGIGLGTNYPHPGHRECGDIDMFLFGDYEKGNELMELLGIEVEKKSLKHSNFFFKGVPVENHKTFLNIEGSQTDKNLEQHLHRVLEQQGFDILMVGDVPVRIPTPDFTATFLTRHDMTHFLASGLVLRYLCDLGLFFTRNRERIDLVRFEELMRAEGQYDFLCSFFAIAQRHLGMPKEGFPINPLSSPKMEILTHRVLEDTLYNKHRSLDKKVLETMWVPRRKLFGLGLFFGSAWKYRAIDRGLFYKAFIHRICLNFHPDNWR